MARDVTGCVELTRALVPEFEPAEVVPPAEVSVGLAWVDECAPLVLERVLAAAGLFRSAEQLEFPLGDGTQAMFMREIADVHRELYAEAADLYGENIRPKIERCLEVSDAEVAEAVRARDALRADAERTLGEQRLLLTPTLGFVAPPADVDEIGERGSFVQFTYPFNALGWPALALPAGPAEDGLPASVQLVGRPGDDAYVLAAGLALEAALAR
jgi:aspartyl-tRNA(Asn)/glutamyl-tRNA(Gln) amidotransferase subunit A